MLAYAISIAALVAFTVHAIAVASLMHGRGANVDLSKLVGEVEAFVRERKRRRAIEELARVERGTPARQLLLFMLGLEIPARTSSDVSGAGYRDAPVASSFDDEVRKKIDTEEAELLATLRSAVITAIASGPVATILCLAALVYGSNFWRVSSLCGATGSVIGVVIAISTTRGFYKGIADARARVAALLRPIEQMDEEARKGASLARSELTAINLESDPPIATVLIFIVLGWVAIGFIVSQSGR